MSRAWRSSSTAFSNSARRRASASACTCNRRFFTIVRRIIASRIFHMRVSACCCLRCCIFSGSCGSLSAEAARLLATDTDTAAPTPADNAALTVSSVVGVSAAVGGIRCANVAFIFPHLVETETVMSQIKERFQVPMCCSPLPHLLDVRGVVAHQNLDRAPLGVHLTIDKEGAVSGGKEKQTRGTQSKSPSPCV